MNYQKSDPLEQLDELQLFVLVDDVHDTWTHLNEQANKNSRKVRVDIVLDNAGFELFVDLCFAEFLLQMGLAKEIHLHAKAIPWFVSDTTPQDFWWSLEMLRASNNKNMSQLGSEWHHRIKDGSFVLEEDDFWTLPHDYAEMHSVAPDLYQNISLASLVIFKGDLHYRKLTGDLNWPHTTKFVESLRGFLPAPLCILRTLKAEVVVGLEEGQDKKVEAQSTDWMVSGQFAVIQFCSERNLN